MYWWSNIAYPNSDGARVIVPADKAFISSYRNGSYIMDYQPLFNKDIKDRTYPENNIDSYDYFYDIQDESNKWITAIEKDGYGLFQCSTKELTGRKLFVWGTSRGGKNWNEFLSVKGSGYFEIQAGLAKTQLEHLPMKPYEVWEWTELYGAVQLDPNDAFSTDWNLAIAGVENAIKNVIGEDITSGCKNSFVNYENAKTVSLEQLGSGWGCVKNAENSRNNLPPISNVLEFPKESVTLEEKCFFDLVRNGKFPCPSVEQAPLSYAFSNTLKELLLERIKDDGNNWFAYYHLGVMEYAFKNLEKAKEYWEKSILCENNAWTLRNIAMLYRNEYLDFDNAVSYMCKAFNMQPTNRNIAHDALETLIKAGKYQECIETFEQLDENLKNIGKMQYFKAYALTKLRKYELARKIINNDFVMDDNKEGDISISDLWFTLYGAILEEEGKIKDGDNVEDAVEKYYPLGELDFRMHTK